MDTSPTGLPLSLRLITDMHQILLHDVRGGSKSPGQFRRTQVHVGSDLRYIPPPAGTHLAECLDRFERYLHGSSPDLDPLVQSHLVHYQFEAIHPFLDGNGRVGRALLALTTFQWSQLQQPWLYMSAYFERYKDEYVDNLFRVSTHGDWGRWIEYCLHGTVMQCQDSLDRLDRLEKLRQLMHDQADTLSPRMHLLIEQMFVRPVFTAADVATWGNASKPTARADIGRLENAGFVEYLQGKRPRVYFAKPIYSVAYAEPDAPARAADGVAPEVT